MDCRRQERRIIVNSGLVAFFRNHLKVETVKTLNNKCYLTKEIIFIPRQYHSNQA